MHFSIHPSFLIKCVAGVLVINAVIWGKEANQSASEFDTLAGPLPKILRFRGKPYYVVADIEVPANRVVTVEPGVVILFRNFTGLHVTGKLIAEGTGNLPIVFTSENNKKYNPKSLLMPNPYDWNGIYIHDDAFGTILTYCEVSYTVYGIISDTKYIKLDPVTLFENGKSDLIIEGKEHTVTGNPYHYTLSTKDVNRDGVPIKVLKDPLMQRRNILRYSGLAAAVGGFGAGIYYAVQFSNSWEKWKEVNAPNPDISILQKGSEYYEKTRDRKNNDLLLMCVGMGVGLVGSLGFTFSFTF